MNRLSVIISSFTATLLISCAGAPPTVTPLLSMGSGDIRVIQNTQQLQNLLSQLKADLQGKDPQLYAEDIAKVPVLEDQIVSVLKQELDTRLAAARLGNGAIALNNLNAESIQLNGNTLIPAAKWQTLQNVVALEREKTESLIGNEKAKLANAGEADKLALLDSLYTLTGDQSWVNQKQQLERQQKARLNELVAEIESAQIGETIDPNLSDKVAEAKELAKDNPVIIDKLIGVDAAIYETRFFTALAEGSADNAYDVFSVLKQSEDFPKYKEKLASSSQKMADYFIALADESVKDAANLAQSYRWYSQARDIRNTFNANISNPEGELALIEQLEYQSAVAEGQTSYSKALAYMYLAEDLRSSKADLRQKIQLAENNVRDHALVKLSTTAFQTSEGQSAYADVVSSSITQYLFEKIPNDVRIIEREQYEAIVREKTLGNTMADLSAVDMLVTGSVLDAKVDSTEAQGKKTMRVVIGKETIPNPAYIAWLEKPERERKNIPTPSETIQVDQQENISVNLTRHRKIGTFAVSYRLVDANSGKILFPDSVKKDAEYTDESSEGVEMGDFKLDFKLANLPSNGEILDRLAKEVSSEIGGRLVAQLENQDQQYLRKADGFATSNACNNEVDMLGKSLIIMDLKDLDTTAVRKRLTARTLQCDF